MSCPPSELPEWTRAARAKWRWRGQERPAFAAPTGPGQTSVWDFPRPPRLAPESREVVVHWMGREVARTRRAVKVLETGHPPTYYLPWSDVARHLMQLAPGGSFCEWKGPAQYWSLVHDRHRLPAVAWSYPQPFVGAEALSDGVAFYAHSLDCSVGGAPVQPQPGGFYGGWITPDLAGPYKGQPGSDGW